MIMSFPRRAQISSELLNNLPDLSKELVNIALKGLKWFV